MAKTHAVPEAEREAFGGHLDNAAALYKAALLQTPNDPAVLAGLTRTLLMQQKIAEAGTLIREALAKDDHSAVLLTALGEVQYREGTPWLASKSVVAAAKLDLCDPRMHLLSAKLSWLDTDYASGAKELALAHSLDPNDPAIRSGWMRTLPLSKRISEMEAYLASDSGDDAEDLARVRLSLESLKKRQADPPKPCRLVSTTTTTEIPFTQILRDPTHVRAFGLEVKLNDHNVRLQIDTGASGLVVSRSVAEHAHLTQLPDVSSTSGSKGKHPSYTAYAESIVVGGLEFHDCRVHVIDGFGSLDLDGSIGTNVFSRFLVTLDFPLRRLALGALPKRPAETATAIPSLDTSASQSDAPEAEKTNNASAAVPTTAASAPILHGPSDRYIAPEMEKWTRIYRVGQDLLIPTLLNDTGPKLFLLSTAMSTTTISPAVARTLTKVSASSVRVMGINGPVDKVYSADEIELKFGNIRQKAHDLLSFESPLVSQGIGLEVAGSIGATELGQMTMSIDYRDGLVKFDYDAKRGYKYPGLQ